MQEPFRLNGKALFFKTLKLQFMKRIILWLFLVLPALSGCSDKPDPEPTGEGKIIVLMYHRITEERPQIFMKEVQQTLKMTLNI